MCFDICLGVFDDHESNCFLHAATLRFSIFNLHPHHSSSSLSSHISQNTPTRYRNVEICISSNINMIGIIPDF